MTIYWLTPENVYYEGDKASSLDVSVIQRPAAYYTYSNGNWVIDINLLEPLIGPIVQAWLDSVAQLPAYQYQDLSTALSYISDPTVTLWQKQAVAFAAWRSNVWSYCFSTLAAIQAGQQQVPASLEAFMSSLPQPNIPTS